MIRTTNSWDSPSVGGCRKTETTKMEIIFKCLAFFVGLTLAASYDVNKVDIHTSDCEDCGMSAFGRLSIKVLSIQQCFLLTLFKQIFIMYRRFSICSRVNLRLIIPNK